ncbi:MAG: fumarate hydratase [Candidatus Omnitrophota bacterium]
MRKINVSIIKEAVYELCLKANFELRGDVLRALEDALAKEKNARAKNIIKTVIENAELAKKERIAICQDTGMVIVHISIGQNVSFVGGDLNAAINKGVAEAYRKGCLRKSVVSDAIVRENTNTNTPAVIYADIIEGDRVKIIVSPKGFGSENKSMIKMFKPTDPFENIKEFILDVVRKAGPDACPPMILGIGLGGTFEKCAYLAKKALLRPIDKRNPKKHIAKLERELMREINYLGMGPMALGGSTTVLGVNILEAPTHIAGLPVAVNVSCHATRSAEKTI